MPVKRNNPDTEERFQQQLAKLPPKRRNALIALEKARAQSRTRMSIDDVNRLVREVRHGASE
jgi:hypothetical protein